MFSWSGSSMISVKLWICTDGALLNFLLYFGLNSFLTAVLNVFGVLGSISTSNFSTKISTVLYLRQTRELSVFMIYSALMRAARDIAFVILISSAWLKSCSFSIKS